MRSIALRETRRHKVQLLPAVATLALWQMRHVWRIFALVALGMIAAVVLVGATPLFARVNTTASIRSAFATSGSDPSSYAQATIEDLDPSAITQTIQHLKRDYRQQGGPFFDLPPVFSIHLIFTSVYRSNSQAPINDQLLSVHGYDMGHIASHVRLLQGRLPQTTEKTANNVLEVALTEANATALGAYIGSIYTISAAQAFYSQQGGPPLMTPIPMTLKVVGILHNLSATAFEEPFWHTDELNYHPATSVSPADDSIVASNAGLLSFFQRLSQTIRPGAFLNFPSGAYLYSYFPLDIQAINDRNINELQPDLDYFTNQEPSHFTGFFIDNISIDNTNITLINLNIKDLSTVVQVPVLALLGLMVGLILLFVTLMTELLVLRQAEAIAIMRSRGATAGQIFLIFVVQSLLLGLFTVFIGPLLIPLIIRTMVVILFPPITQNALNVLPTVPWEVLFALGWYIWTAVILVILTMCLAVWRMLGNSTLGRSIPQSAGGQRPLWQRLYVDVIMALLGVLTYGLYTYLTSIGIVDVQLQVVLGAPCMLVAATLFCLAAMLLALRLFPLLIQRGASLAAQGTGIVPLVALVLMARAPRQAMRTTMLLIFTIAFALFAQVFLATQVQRAVDISNYVMAADFSGFFPTDSTFSGTFEQQEARYRTIPGVLSATLGYVGDESFQNLDTTSLTVIATDPGSIGTSITWPRTDNLTALNTALRHLADQRTSLIADQAKAQQGSVNKELPPIPAIVSTATSNLLHLSVGKLFFMSSFNSNGGLAFIDSAEVPYLPGVPNILTDRGILVDYASFKAAYSIAVPSGAPLAPTMAWFHTRQDSASLASVQQALSSAPFKLMPLLSHQSILAALQDDPLFLNLLCILGLGLGLTLLLAWISCLASAWSYVRIRLRSLLVLRALGSTPAQLALLLSFEQIMIYTTALILGIGCGVGFIALTLPQMIFSNASRISEITSVFTLNLFQLQSTPPLQVIVPSTVIIGLGAIVLLCAVGIGLTATMVMRLSPAQMLRLSEDYVEEAPVRSEKREVQALVSNQEELTDKQQTFQHAMELECALTPMHRSWSMLGLTQLGVVISVLFVCVVPLFSQVAATAGLHDVLTLPANRFVTVTNSPSDAVPLGYVQAALTQGTKTLNRMMFEQAGAYFHTPPIVTLSDVYGIRTEGTPAQFTSASALTFASISAAALADQVQLLQGQLPQQIVGAGGHLPIMLTPQAANYLHVHVGDMLTRAQGYPLDMQLVALFHLRGDATLLPTTDFFHYNNPKSLTSGMITALTTTEGLTLAVDALGRTQPPGSSVLAATVTWNYPVNEAVTSLQLDNLISTLSALRLEQAIVRPHTFTLSTPKTPVDALLSYQQSVVVSSIPIFCTSFLVLALFLLFLNFMVGLLVEREASTIAILCSRGATQRQIFAAFLKRALLINGIGLLAAMALAVPVIIVLTRLTLRPEDQVGLHQFADHPWQTFWSLAGFAGASIGITVLAMGMMLFQATRIDYLSLRREMTRETRKSLWQRWYLDVVGIVLALTAYGFSLYLTNANILDPAINVQVKSPLILTATICLVLACMLALLRFFPLLLRLGTKVAMRNRGIASMLAFSLMAHSPRQRLRTALLLLLTTAFVVFAVVFNASRAQHINDTAQYWAQADFSGSLPHPLSQNQVGNVQNAYQHVKGVTSIALGDMETIEVGTGSIQMPMQMQTAVDPKSFMHIVKWPGLDTPAQQEMVIARLNNPSQFRDLASAWFNTSDDAVPAVIATASAHELGVKPGQTFVTNGPLGQVTVFVVAEVDGMPPANILFDYPMYNLIYQAQSSGSGIITTAPINYIWLKTDGSVQSLQHVRQTLGAGPLRLFTFYDQQATAQELARNPLNRNLVGILALGTFAPLLLTWIGCLMASLVEMRQRRLIFGVLRALGSTPTQLARVFGWEQALIFGVSIILGTLFGLLTAFLALPSLILTNVLPTLSIAQGGNLASGTQDLFSWQNIPVAHTVISPLLGLVVALLILLALIAVVFMTRSASSIALGQALRLNED